MSDFDDALGALDQPNTAATAQVVGNINENPDQAAKALKVSQASGVPAPVVHDDFDYYDGQTKADLASRIVKNNPQIQAYVANNPMAAKVSNDDYAQLDSVSQSAKWLASDSIWQATSKAFSAGFDFDNYVEEGRKLDQALPPLSNPANYALSSALKIGDLAFRGMSGGMQAVAAGLGELVTGATGDRPTGDRFMRDMLALGQVSVALEGAPHGLSHEAVGLHNDALRTAKVAEKALPYVKEGKEPPAGIHPDIDQLKAQQNDADLEHLKQALKDSQGSSTLERAPDMFKDFVAQHTGDNTVGVTADVAAKLYSDKVPTADDGLLGFVSDMPSQILRAQVTGEDVQIPMADYIAKMDPQVHAQIEDGVRVRPGGVTKEEASSIVEAQKSNTLSLANKTLKQEGEDYITHDYDINNSEGSQVADAKFSYYPEKKHLDVDWIGGSNITGDANKFGLSAVRKLLGDIRKEYPDAETIGGTRISGARSKSADIVLNFPKPDPIVDSVRQGAGIGEPAPIEVIPESEAPPTRADKAKQTAANTERLISKYNDLVATSQKADFEAVQRKALATARERLTPEWQTAEQAMTKQVQGELRVEPRFMADQMLREARIDKLDTDALTDAQRASLPDDYVRRNGIDPDHLARQLGYESGDEMVKDLAIMHAEREAEGITPKEYMDRTVAQEVERRMKAEHGSLDKDVIDQAKDHVLSDIQMQLSEVEAQALAEQAGTKPAFSKDQLQVMAQRDIAAQKIGDVSSDKILAAAGRAGRASEVAKAAGDFKEAFRLRQRQFAALMYSREALRVEQVKKAFDKRAKQYSARDVAGASPEYVNQIHDILQRIGLPTKGSAAFIAENLGKDTHKNLADFVASKEGEGRSLYVPEFMQDPNFKTGVKDMTVEQFQQVDKAFKAIAFNARAELKVDRAGEKADFVATRDEMIQSLQTLKGNKLQGIDRKEGYLAKNTKAFWWSSMNLESIFNRFDRDNPKGVFNQTLVRNYTEAANYAERLAKEYQGKLADLGEFGNLDKAIKNDLFIDPRNDQPFLMTRRNVLGVLQNVGNESNMQKLAGGYGLQPKQVMDWLAQHTTKEDWDRAQKIGEHFNDLHKMADNMSRNISGVGIDKIDLKPIDTPFGQYNGWYHPVKYDYVVGKDVRSKGLDDGATFRATTPQGYTKDRSRYVAPIELNLDIVPTRMKQMIHDIATRPSVIQMGKFFYDDKFMQAIKDNYGIHQSSQMVPFLRDFANTPEFNSMSSSIGNEFINRLSSNMVGASIGLNANTVLKHGLTAMVKSFAQQPVGFTKELGTLLSKDGDTGNTNWAMAFEKSDELHRRLSNWKELIDHNGQELSLKTSDTAGLFRSLRSWAQYTGTLPIAMFDMMSSVPTFLATYKRAIAEGADEGQAVYLANRDVRMTHGSSVITNRPAIARSKNAVANTFAKYYGFFSENLQKQYQVAWMIKDAVNAAREGDMAEATRNVPKIGMLLFTSTIIPAMIEHAVMSTPDDKHKSWGRYAGELAINGATSSLIGFRDLGNVLTQDSHSAGDFLTGVRDAITHPLKDIVPDKQGRIPVMNPTKMGDFLKHSMMLTGLATGITNTTEANSVKFMYNYYHNQEHPRSLNEWRLGLQHGKLHGYVEGR